MKVMETGRGRKGTPDGITLGMTGTWAQVEDGKGGQLTGEGRHGSHKKLLWVAFYCLVGKHRRAVAFGGRGRCPVGRSLHELARGGG